MSDRKFNLNNYKKTNGDEHIDMRLEEARGNIPNVINEKQLEKYRSEESNVSIQKMLEKSRTGEETEVTEKRLDTHKSKFANKYRNPETFEGDMNKLEEQRLKNKPVENEKYETASETPSQFRWWEEKSPDGLKLAGSKSKIVTAADETFKAPRKDLSDFGQDYFGKGKGGRFKGVGEEGEVSEYQSKGPQGIDPDNDNIVEPNVTDATEEEDEEYPNEEDLQQDVEEDEEKPVVQGTMKLVRVKQTDPPAKEGLSFQLAFNPSEFGGDKDAITEEIISSIAESKPELAVALLERKQDIDAELRTNPVADPRLFDYFNIDNRRGVIDVGLVGSEWDQYYRKQSQLDAPEVEKNNNPVQSDRYIEESFDTQNIDGTPMAMGAINVLVDINTTNKDAVENEIIAFIKQNHPEILIDKKSLDIAPIKGKEVNGEPVKYQVQFLGSVNPEFGVNQGLSADEELDRIEKEPDFNIEDLSEFKNKTPEERAEDEEFDINYKDLTDPANMQQEEETYQRELAEAEAEEASQAEEDAFEKALRGLPKKNKPATEMPPIQDLPKMANRQAASKKK